MPHCVYIAKCSDGSLYTGYTTDPEARIRRHNAGTGARYTRSRRPVRLAYVERLSGRTEALRREVAIKRLTRKEKLLLCRKYEGRARHSQG
jgi:putative endonuclease